jgi:toxin ParE1/3/4
MNLRWTPAAADDLEAINEYLELRFPQYRQATIRKLYDAARELKRWPYKGRPATEEGIREIVFTPLPYILVYRVTGLSVEILRIYHAAQDYRAQDRT